MATITAIGTTISNWGSTSSWSPAQIPTIGDLVIFTSSSPTFSLNVTGTCSQIDFTNYNKQFRFNTNNLVVYGNITFGNQMSFSFSSAGAFSGYNLIMSASGSITSNGATVGVPFGLYNSVGNNNVYTVVNNLNCSENFGTGAGAGSLTHTINGATISLFRGFSPNGIGSLSSTTLTTGTSNIVMLGTGTLASGAAAAGGLGNNFTINTTGTITLPANFYYRTGTFSIIGTPNFSGTGYINFTGNANLIAASSSSTYILPIGIASSAISTVNLGSDFHTRWGLNTNGLTLNNNNVYIYGNIFSNLSNTSSGTTVYRISGTGPGSNVNMSASTQIGNAIVINTPGTANITANFLYSGSSFIYTAGNVIVGANFNFAGTTTAVSVSMPSTKFLTVNFGVPNATYTLLSDWNMTTYQNGGAYNITFTGSNAWTTDNWIQTSGGAVTLTLRDGLTYSILKQLNISPTANYTNLYSIVSGASGSYANLYVAPGATQTMYSVSMKDINNTGAPLWIYNPTIINSTNIWDLDWRSLQQTTISGF